ncbi:MAG TPA: VWA domain-containing protein [Methylomirabilota bacterium]|nr:VWA domain-containing protein [Methylomirabilota bacterium]
MLIRYSRWDGSQDLPELDADAVLEEMADDVLSHGDLRTALQRLMRQGLQPPQGQRLPGLKDLLERLRQSRQQRLGRYDLGSSLDDIKRRLDDIVRTEREGIERRLSEMRQGAQRGDVPPGPAGKFERLAARNREALDALPPDPAGRIRELQKYDFVDPDARRKFEELLASLREQALQPFLQGMQRALSGLTPADLKSLREMLQDLNRMLRERAEGREPDFEAFRRKWGDRFPGAESLDQLLDQLGQQMARMQSLLRSLSPGQRRQLDELMRSLFMRDERLEAALSQLSMHLSELLPMDNLVQRYPFRGDEEMTLAEAMRVMEELQELDQLERELKDVRALEELQAIPRERLERLLGEDAAEDLERLKEIARKLEEAGYLERDGDELRLTARAIRKIADKALREIFLRLKRDRVGGHAVARRGAGGDPMDESKAYEFGDPFLLDLKGTVMRGIERRGPGTPVALEPGDFQVFRTELRSRAATVVMLDMSRSMLNNGYFLPAKKVTLALSALIRSQFPRDALSIVGFSLYAREFTPDQLPALSWSEWNVGTNMHAGFMLARRLLARHAGGTRQIIMVTDGEPTAHMEGDVADFAYPPTRRTVEETLREVRRCTRDGITINTFMLERTPWLTAFVEEMTRLNRGRAFFAAPDRLGEYVVVDYVTARRRSLA